MSEHTPGPWMIHYEKKHDGDDLPISGWVLEDSTGTCLVGIMDRHKNDEANAYLIAAAPDLLEAVKEAEEICDAQAECQWALCRWCGANAHDVHGITHHDNCILLRLRRSIAKSKGAKP